MSRLPLFKSFPNVLSGRQILLSGFVSFLLISCSPIVYSSLWQTNPVKADGIANEWNKPLKHYDSSTKLQYTFSNDKQNMYICIRATDESTQKKILRGGMVVWIDTSGRGKERTSISYPLPDMNTKPEAEGEMGTRERDAYHPKRKFHNDHNEMTLSGFKGLIGGTVPLKNLDGIAVNLNVDSLDILTYEAIIPFKTFYRDSLCISDSSRVMSFKIVINGLPQAKQKPDPGVDNTGNNTPSLSGANMGGRGSRGGGGRGGQGPSNPMFESHSIKSQIKLVVKGK
jgi:hypothetical protein